MIVAMIGLSMPNFWLGLLLIIVFSLNLGWFPSGGDQTLSSIVLPAITIGTGLMATLTRTTRSSMLDVLKQEYLRTARAKGIPEKIVITSHALRNALIPIITIIGTQLAGVLGGSVLTETVFAWPGALLPGVRPLCGGHRRSAAGGAAAGAHFPAQSGCLCTDADRKGHLCAHQHAQ